MLLHQAEKIYLSKFVKHKKTGSISKIDGLYKMRNHGNNSVNAIFTHLSNSRNRSRLPSEASILELQNDYDILSCNLSITFQNLKRNRPVMA